MVNRTKISKEISRRTGGISQKTGKGKTVKQINIWKDEWEQIPGTGTSPYNPPEFRLKEKPDLPIKRQTKKPIGAGPKDVKKAASKRQYDMLYGPEDRSKQMAYYNAYRNKYMSAQGGRVPGGYNTGGLSNLFRLKNK